MTIYARVEKGVVLEIIEPVYDGDGIEIPIVDRFTSEFVSELIDVTSVIPQPSYMWRYDGSTFRKPDIWSLPE